MFLPGAGQGPEPGQSGVQKSAQKSRGLAVLVGLAGWPRDCPNSGWVDQGWGAKLVG